MKVLCQFTIYRQKKEILPSFSTPNSLGSAVAGTDFYPLHLSKLMVHPGGEKDVLSIFALRKLSQKTYSSS